MAIGACLRRKLLRHCVAKVQAGSAARCPSTLVRCALGASLTSVTNEKGKVRLDAVDCDLNLLAAVFAHVTNQLSVVHGNEVFGVDIFESVLLGKTALNLTGVCGREISAASRRRIDIVVVCAESSSTEDGISLGGCGEQASCCNNFSLHFRFLEESDCIISEGRTRLCNSRLAKNVKRRYTKGATVVDQKRKTRCLAGDRKQNIAKTRLGKGLIIPPIMKHSCSAVPLTYISSYLTMGTDLFTARHMVPNIKLQEERYICNILRAGR